MLRNGVKRVSYGANTGTFGVINLLGPRDPSQSSFWDQHYTQTQFRVEFITTLTGQPLQIGRTFITFCACRVASTSPAPRDSLQP